MATSTITLKTDTTANWEASNRVLNANEPGLERTTDGYVNMKIGDGTTPWNDLGYVFKLKTLEEIKTYVEQKYNSIVTISDNFDNKISVLTASAESAITRANNAAAAAEGIVAEKVGINDTESGASTTYSSSKIDTMITTLQSTIGALHTSSWLEVQKIVAAGFGKTAFPVGTQFTTKHTDTAFKDSTTGLIYWDVVSHQTVLTPGGEMKPAMILMAHYASSGGINFDASEDLYHAPDGLTAGTYWFGIPTNYDTANNDLLTGHEDDYQTLTLTKANGTETTETVIPVQFTTTKDIPAGGTFRLAWNYNTKLSTAKITTYKADKTSLESGIAIAEGATGTYLGVSAGNVGYGNFNTMLRNRYGSNNWKESNVRQYLNATQATAAEWYSISTRFDRNGISKPGFIYGLSSSGETDFLSVVKPVRHYTVTNNLYEESGNIGAYDTTDDTFWLASRSEIDNSKEGTIKDGTQFEYFSENTNACRIKYNNSGSNTVGTAQYWWLRSPYVGITYIARLVNTSGAVSTSGAYNGDWLVPACAIY